MPDEGHTLRGCVDWNMFIELGKKYGLMSHPAWVCGLKHGCVIYINCMRCHTLRGCVDWNINYSLLFAVLLVTPCVGVWIETFLIMIRLKSLMSHPAWVCGLKPQLVTTRPRKDVSHPAWVCGLKLIGRGANDATTSSHPAWVCGLKPRSGNGMDDRGRSHPAWVCGLKPFQNNLANCYILSHPAWVCGLKQPGDRHTLRQTEGHTLRGCVDWNECASCTSRTINSHTLRGCVDWNIE